MKWNRFSAKKKIQKYYEKHSALFVTGYNNILYIIISTYIKLETFFKAHLLAMGPSLNN